MVYIWRIPDNFPEQSIAKYDEEASPDRFILQEGREIRELGPFFFSATATCESLMEFDDIANNALVPLLSERAVAVLTICKEQIQLLPAVVKASDRETNVFKVLNVTQTVSGIDRNESKFTMVPGTDEIMSIEKLVLKPDCLGKNDIARDEDYLTNLLISDKLADALRKANLKGIGILKPEDFSQE